MNAVSFATASAWSAPAFVYLLAFSFSLLDHSPVVFAATHSCVNPPRAFFMPRYDTLPVEESRPPARRQHGFFSPALTMHFFLSSLYPLFIYCLFSCCDESDVEHPLENRILFLCIFCLTLFFAFSSYIAFSCIPSTPILLNTSRAFSCIAAYCFIRHTFLILIPSC